MHIFNLIASLKEMHQAHQARLTVMSNQLELKYEHRITQLLEQINASELQEVKSIFYYGTMFNSWLSAFCTFRNKLSKS